MNTDIQYSPIEDRDMPRPASATEIDALQRAVRRAQARLAAIAAARARRDLERAGIA